MIINVKNLTAILTILMLLTACKRAAVDLKGHWHVWEYFDPEKYPEMYQSSGFDDLIVVEVDSCEGLNRPHEMLDIVDDSIVVWNRGIWGYDGTIGWLDNKQKLIEIGGEDLHLKFNYDLRNDTLFLTQQDGKILIATKSGCCDKQKEFFTEVPRIEIDLPVLTDKIGYIKLSSIKRTLSPDIEIGKIAQIYMEHTLPIRFLLEGQFSNLGSVKFWLENCIQNVPSSLQKAPTPIVYSNKTTDYKLFFDLLESLKKNGVESVYLAFREKKYPEVFNVWLKKIDLQNFDYQSFIKNNYQDYYQETGEERIEIN